MIYLTNLGKGGNSLTQGERNPGNTSSPLLREGKESPDYALVGGNRQGRGIARADGKKKEENGTILLHRPNQGKELASPRKRNDEHLLKKKTLAK